MDARYKVVLAYDGSAFRGMQRQKNGRSVQAEVETALRPLGWGGSSLLAAGRTDAGVHASGQVVAFDLAWRHGPQALQRALNAGLPADVAAVGVGVAAADFHPRYDARSRRYEYRLYCQAQRDPLRERYAWRVWPAPGLRRLQAAARPLRGEHDFAAFGSPPKPGGSTVRRVLVASWRKTAEDEFVFSVSANGFLQRMVRRMVGLQVHIAQGGAEPELVAEMLSGKHGKVRQLAPPQGLTLVAVQY
ncbi:MAG: tRNA pseudouridine(38-40) synthase TruA [Anaerolineales bacterium]|nr:tRNA pseudouridine(38-40) synthase TruA [Anaerolineales bacterium]